MHSLVDVGVFAYRTDCLPELNKYRYVYFVTAWKPLDYPNGRSRIVYIGEFDQRDPKVMVPFSSLGWMVSYYVPGDVGDSHIGIPLELSLLGPGPDLSPVDCEGAFIDTFRKHYGALPHGNHKGGGVDSARAAAQAGFTEEVILEILARKE